MHTHRRTLRYILGALLGVAISGGIAVAVATLSSVLGPAASASPACTATFNNTAGDNEWTTASNWAADALPGSSDVVCFGAGVTSLIYNTSAGSSVAEIDGTGVTLQVLGTGNLTVDSTTDTSTLSTLEVTNGQATFSGPATISTVDVDGGTLSGAGTITATSLNWSSGDISGGDGTITVTGATTITTSLSNVQWYIYNYTIEASGGATFTSSGITDPGFEMDGSAEVLLDGSSASDITSDIGPGYVITNSGGNSLTISGDAVLDETGAAGSVVTVDTELDNNSSAPTGDGVNVPAGDTFEAASGYASTSSGDFSGGANSTIELGDATLNGNINGTIGASGTTFQVYSSTVNGSVTAGTLETVGGNETVFTGGIDVTNVTMSNATFDFNGSASYTIGSVDLDGGTLGGSANPTAGTFDWSSGNMDGSPGRLTVTGATTITTSLSNVQWYIYNYTIEASGGATFTSSGITDPGFEMDGSAEVLLDGSSASDITSDIGPGYVITNSGGNSLTISGDAVLDETGAAGSVVTVDTELDNNSSAPTGDGVNVPAGDTFEAASGYASTSSGDFSGGANSTIELGDATLNGNINGTTGASGTTFQVYNSTVNGSVTAGTLETVGGNGTTFTGGIDVTNVTMSNATFDFNGSASYTIGSVDLDGGTLGGSANPTAGTFDWSSGNMDGSPGRLTVTGATTITTSLSNVQWYIYNYTIEASDGATFTSSGITDPGFEMDGSAEVLLDGSSASDITSDIGPGYVITNSGGNSLTISGDAVLDETGAAGSVVTVDTELDNNSSAPTGDGVNVPAGDTFEAASGYASTSSGDFSGGANSTIELGDATLNGNINGTIGASGTTFQVYSSTVNGSVTAGTLETVGGNETVFTGGIDVTNVTMSNATFDFNGSASYTIGSVDLDGGQLGGSANPTAGTFDWSSGNMNGSPGRLTVTGATTITTSLSNVQWYIYNYTIEASDGATFTSSGITDPGFEMDGSAEVLLDGSSASDITSDIGPGYVITNSGGNSLTISGDAVLDETGAAGSVVTVDTELDNNSSAPTGDGVNVPAGDTFEAASGYYESTSSGDFSGGANSTIELGEATLNGNINGTTGASGTTFQVYNSTVNGSVTAGTLETVGGNGTTFTGGIDVTNVTMSNATFDFNGSASYTIGSVDLDGGTLGGSANPTTGTFDWSSGNISGATGDLTVTGLTTISTSESSTDWYISSYTLTAAGGATFSSAVSDPGLYIDSEAAIDLEGASTIGGNEVIQGGYDTALNVESGTLSIGSTNGTTQIQAPFTNDGAVTVPTGSVVDFGSTYTQAAGSTTLAAPSSELIASSVDVTGGTLQGSGTVGAPVSNTAGTVQGGAGTTPGTLTIVGIYTEGAGGTLVANLAGATAGSGYSQVDATSASIGGTLDVNDQSSFAPTGADTFSVLVTESGVSGTFATVNAVGFSVSPNVTYTTDDVQVSFATTITPTVKVTSTSSSTVYGQGVTFTATVTGAGPIATGTVQLKDGSSDLGSPQTLSNGVATLATSSLPVGAQSITGVYSGNSSYAPGTSPAITVTVSKVATTLVLKPSVSTASAGESVTLNAIVTAKSPSTAYANGSVTFYNGKKKIGTATLSSGVASVKTSFAAGKFSLKASYPGNSDFGSSSGTATETVVSTGSSTSITESTSRVLSSVPVTFTATVKASSGSTVPTGDVQFYSGVNALGKGVKLNSKGIAKASYGFAHGGTYSIHAEYLGTTSRGGSVSKDLSLLVQEPGYRLVGQDGGVFDFGGAGYYGSLPHENIVPATPVVGMAPTPTGLGYWLVTKGAHVYPFGDAKTYSADSGTPSTSIVAIVPTADGKGYWLFGATGLVYRYGDAASYGDKSGLSGVVGAAGTPDGKGYWITTSSGKVYAFGDAKTESATKGQSAISGTISSMAPTIDGKGYYLVNTAGVVYSYGDAKNYGNAKNPSAAITGIAESPRGTGYWLAGADGSVYNLGSAPDDGSVLGSELTAPICGASSFP